MSVDRVTQSTEFEICFVLKANRQRLKQIALAARMKLSSVAVREHAWAGTFDLSLFHILTLYSNL